MIQDKSRGLFAFDAILMDGAMAPMGGHECSRRLRAMGVLCPIYAVSGSSEDDDVQTFLEAGATRLMAKPVRIEELISWLKEDTGFAFSHDTQPAKKQGKCPTPRKSSSPRGAEAASSSSSSSSFSSSRQSAPSATETMPPPSLLASAEVSASPPPVSSAMRKRKAADPTTPEARPTATLKTTRSSSRLKRKDGDIREDTPRPKKKYK
jgi:CheY-like chemotaxis protein